MGAFRGQSLHITNRALVQRRLLEERRNVWALPQVGVLWRLPLVLPSAGGKVRGPEEPHIGWKGVEESLELWGPSPIRARPPT